MSSDLFKAMKFLDQFDSGEPLVSLSQLSPHIQVYPYYFHQKLPHALADCYLREGAADRLCKATRFLPEGYVFVVLDGFRPLEVQQFLYEKFRDEFSQKGGQIVLDKYVAIPSESGENPSPHLTGGAVDLTIANADGLLEMGTGFDEFNDKTRTDWYEQQNDLSPKDQIIRDHRRLLVSAMEKVDFVNYAEEWWHFDYGNRNWARRHNTDVIYYGLRI